MGLETAEDFINETKMKHVSYNCGSLLRCCEKLKSEENLNFNTGPGFFKVSLW